MAIELPTAAGLNVANLGNRPGCGQEDAPCQAEETDQGPQLIIEQIKNCLKLLMNFCQGSSLQSSTNYRANKNSLKLVKKHPSKNSLKSVKERQSKEVEQQYNF